MGHVRKSFLIAIHALALGSPLPAQPSDLQPALAAIRPQAIRAHMRFLADDLLEGRKTATRGYDLAAKYVASHFEMLGLEPGGPGGSYFQPVPLVEMTTVEPECSLTLLREGRKTVLRYGEDFLALAVPGETSVTAPLVFVGFGVTAPELGYDDYAGIDVKGTWSAWAERPPTFPRTNGPTTRIWTSRTATRPREGRSASSESLRRNGKRSCPGSR